MQGNLKMLLSQQGFLTPENGLGLADDEDEDVDMACLVTSTGLSTAEQLTCTEGRKSPLSRSLSPPPLGISPMCEVFPNSAAKVACDCQEGQKEEEEVGGDREGEEDGGNDDGTKEEEEDEMGKLGVLNTSVNVKIADLGNACWVVS